MDYLKRNKCPLKNETCMYIEQHKVQGKEERREIACKRVKEGEEGRQGGRKKRC